MKFKVEISRKEVRAAQREGARILGDFNDALRRVIVTGVRQIPVMSEILRKIYGRDLSEVLSTECQIGCNCVACRIGRGGPVFDPPTAMPGDAPHPPPDAIGYIPDGYTVNADGFVVPRPAPDAAPETPPAPRKLV